MERSEASVVEAGFWIEPDVLRSAECDALIAALEDRRGSRAGTRHLMSHPAVAAVTRDDRMIAIARKALGASAIPFRATLFEKSAEKNWLIAWHQDTALPLESRFESAEWGPWSEKGGVIYAHAPAWALSRVIALRLHLDDSGEDNGPLRLIEDSHREGVLADARILETANTCPAVTCTVGPGGVIAMRPLAIHASSKARSDRPRRVLHLEYADSLELAAGIRLAVV